MDADEFPKQRHIRCSYPNCVVCFNDAQALQRFLEKMTGDTKTDLLARYHIWLGKNDIPGETEDGWLTAEAYDPTNIQAFIEYWKGDDAS